MPISSDAAKSVPYGGLPVADVVTGGQPSAADLEQLKAAGVRVVVDLRDPMEPRPFDEPAAVRALGMEYVNIPVSGSIGDEQIDRVRDALQQSSEKPVFLHCASANRVGGVLLPHLVLDQGLNEDEATERALQVGLRNPGYLESALDYVRRKRG